MNTVDMTAMPRPPPKGTQNGDVDHHTLSYFVVFTGFFLKEDALKDWLRTCVKQVWEIKLNHANKDTDTRGDFLCKVPCDVTKMRDRTV